MNEKGPKARGVRLITADLQESSFARFTFIAFGAAINETNPASLSPKTNGRQRGWHNLPKSVVGQKAGDATNKNKMFKPITTKTLRHALSRACLGVLLVISVLVVFGGPLAQAAAGTPAILNYQARVTTAGGTPITAATNMRFVIWDSLAGGTCVWSGWGTGTNGCTAPNASQVSVTPVNGVFSIALGDTTVSSQNAMQTDLFNDDSRYLEIQMFNGSTYETLAPRKRILSSAYAFNSNLLAGLATSATGGSSAFIPSTDASGKLTLTAGTSIYGAGISLNDNSNFNTTINTGTSTGGVTIGNVANGGVVGLLSKAAVTITAGAASSWTTSAGNLTITSAGVLNLGAGGSAGNVQIGTDGSMSINASSSAVNALTIGGNTSTNVSGMRIDNWATGGTSYGLWSTNASTYGLASGFGIYDIGAGQYRLSFNSSGNMQVGVGGSGSATPELLLLDTTSAGFGTGNPTGTNGAIYYNSAANKFRCNQAGTWIDCVGSSGSSSLQTAYTNGPAITTSGSTDIAFILTSGSFTATGAGSVNLTPTGASSFISGGALTLTGGAASTWSTSSGALAVDSAAALNLGTTNATSVVLGKTGITTTNNGALTVAQTFTGSAVANYFGTGTLSFITPASLNMMNSAAGTMKTQLNLVNTGGGGGAGSAIDFYTYDVSGGTDPGLRIAGIDNNYSADFAILTKTPGAAGNPLVEKFRITNTGNVGIGVTGPTNKLSIGMTAPPTTDIVNITNAGQANATAGVSGLQITYVGGAAAVEASAERIDLTGGTTAGAGAIWNGLRLTQGTITPGTTVGDIKFETAALTQTSAATTNINGLYMASGTVGSLVQNTGAGTINWTGVDIVTPNITQTTGTILSEGIAVTTGTITTGGTTNGIDIIGQGAAAGTLNGIKIGNITAGGGTESAINIGTGWDNGILFAGAGTIKSTTTNAITLDSGTTGAVNVGNGANAKTITIGNATASTVLNLTTPAAGLKINGYGAVQASGTVTLCINTSTKVVYVGNSATTCISSSRRFKHDIQDLTEGIEAVQKMRPVSYTYNDTGIKNVGFIAEDIAEIDTRLVTYDDDGQVRGIDPAQITPILAQGIKEQQDMLGAFTLNGEDLSTLVTDIQAEAPQDAVATINGKIAIGARFLTNFSAVRVTALRGYFDETFATKTHQEKLCLGDAANGETCVTKEQLDAMLAGKAALAVSGANTATTATTDGRANQVGNITSLASLPVMSDLNMSGFSVDNVLGLNGVNGNWSIDEHGLLTITIKTDSVTSSLYAMTGANAEVVFSGSSQLEAGHGHIAFTKEQKDAMAVVVPYRVNVTMTDSANGVYVSGKNADGFNVVETMGGTSGATFDWLVIARRVGYENANDFGLTPDQLAPVAPAPPIDATPVATTPPPVESVTLPVVTEPPATDTTSAPVVVEPPPTDAASVEPSSTPVATTPATPEATASTTVAPPADTASVATTPTDTTTPTTGITPIELSSTP